MSNSQARREMKRRARENVRRHYLLFIFICLIAAAIGTQFRSELRFLNLDSAQIDTVRGFLASFGREGFEADSRGVLAMAVNRVTSGTLTGIISLAGYCKAANGHELCFSIINNGIMHGNNARNFADKVCELLCKP